MSHVVVGRIVRPLGLRGDVVVESDSDFAETRFRRGASVQATGRGALIVAASRPQGGRWIVRFVGHDTVEAAEALRGVELAAEEGTRPAVPAGTYYLGDLVGCEVVTVAGKPVGRVQTVYTGAAQAVLGVAGRDGEVLIPLAVDICREVDTPGRRIVIAPPEGLLEANAPVRSRPS